MEYAINQLIKSLINPTNIIIFILLILVTVFYKKIRGFMGEFWVKQELKKLPKDKYIILNDIMIKSNKGTHQIDHIIISKYGIFVVEMKNYYGLITGEEHQNKWTQHLGKNKYYFNNPIHQNYGHIKALEALLHLREDNFISSIGISNQAKLKVKAKNVTQLDFISDLIKSYNNEIIIEDLSKIKNKIEQNNITDKEIRKSHIKNIKNTVKENNDKEKNMICPKCGAKLVERNGKYGNFIGCSNFPNCKYTKNINE